MRFSNELVECAKSVFREEDCLDLSDAELEEMLASMAGLFLAFADVTALRSARAVTSALDGLDT